MAEKILQSIYKKSQFVDHHINSYNFFIQKKLPQIIKLEQELALYKDSDFLKTNEQDSSIREANGSKTCNSSSEYSLYFYNPRVESPRENGILIFPHEARTTNISYEGIIYVDVKLTNEKTGIVSERESVQIGKIPVMLKSCICNLTTSSYDQTAHKECVYETGGYYILKGKERVLVGQVRKAYNRIYVESSSDKFDYIAEFRSTNYTGSVLTQLKSRTDPLHGLVLIFSLPFIKLKNGLSAGVVFKALGITREEMHLFCYNDQNYTSLEEKSCETEKLSLTKTLNTQFDKFSTDESVFNFVASEMEKSVAEIKRIFTYEICYHFLDKNIDEKNRRTQTARHLGLMVKKIMTVVSGKRNCDDKNNLANKRIDMDCSLIAFLFSMSFRQMLKSIHTQLFQNNRQDVFNVIKSYSNITQTFKHAFMTGQWNIQKTTTYTRIGVSQVLSMQNYGAKLSHLRRIMLPIGNKGKNIECRNLHGSHFGFMCLFETPEGETVGVVTNLAVSATITTEVDPNLILDKIEPFLISTLGENLYTVVLNGCIVGYSLLSFPLHLEKIRNESKLVFSIVVLRKEREVHIETDDGRLIRPLFTPSEKVVFREVWELEQSIVLLEKEDKCFGYNYIEICPEMTLMGVMASVIPLPNHSQAPRIAYQASMGKQAIGIPSTAFQFRFDTTLNVLNYPSKQITPNCMTNVLNFDKMPHGCNPIVAVMTMHGYNQEDSVILNKASIDRGLFQSTTYKTIVDEEKKKTSTEYETIGLPASHIRNKNYDYSFIGPNGIINKRNQYLKKNTVVIAKTLILTPKTNQSCASNAKSIDSCSDNGDTKQEMKDNSLIIKAGEEGYLDWVIDTINKDKVRIIKIRIRVPKKPEIGDKFASSTAQKGTCGMIFSQEDMPFTEDGMVPDLIINPLALPSRMTINMLIQMAFDLIGCTPDDPDRQKDDEDKRSVLDTSAFRHRNIEQELNEWLKIKKIDGYNSIMYDGITGKKYEAKIFMAPCYYQRLKHLVSEKIHSRVRGPLEFTTRQPLAGRSRDGGLRLGEMERDCILSHGSMNLLNECMFHLSDAFTIPVCQSCGGIPFKRTSCKCSGVVSLKNMPFATKLFLQELLAMGLKIKIK